MEIFALIGAVASLALVICIFIMGANVSKIKRTLKEIHEDQIGIFKQQRELLQKIADKP